MIPTTVLPDICEDLLIQILIRLPVKSLMRFKCVSKLFLSLITSQYLTNRLFKTSPRSRFFLMYMDDKTKGDFELNTSSDHDHSDTSLTVIDKDLTIPTLRESVFVSSVRGLACFRNRSRVQIYNLTTRQVVELPVMNESKYTTSVCYFGHDPVNDEYKVLSTVWKPIMGEDSIMRSEHQVLILGAGASWKNIKCHIPHRPFEAFSRVMITIDGVLYYRALVDAYKSVVISFNLSSEEFSLIELPINVGINWDDVRYRNLMNYKGKVSIFECVKYSFGAKLGVWLLEDDIKSQWCDMKKIILSDFQINSIPGDKMMVGATRHSGKLWLAKRKYGQAHIPHYFIYDMNRNEITHRIEARPLPGNINKETFCFFWDDIENIMYLET